MSGLRVFISHSAKSEAAKTLLQRLKQSLRDAGHQVLLDQDGLSLGNPWRATLNLWIGGCDAALVLLSEHALQSSFVAYEMSILKYRWRINPDFALFPIFIETVDYKAVENSRFLSPIRIDEIQSLINETQPDEIIRRVCDGLAQIVQRTTPIDKPLRQLCHLLSKIPEDVLEEQARELGIDLGGWIPADDLKRILAAKLLGAGLENSINTLRALRCYLPEPRPESLKEMIDLIGSSWVDYRSAELIPEAAGKKRSLCINGERPLTARHYVIRACKHPPRDCWRVAEIDGVTGEEVAANLKEAIEQSLCQTLKVNDTDELQEVLSGHIFYPEPVFVALPSHGVNGDLVQQLQHDFPIVTFFLLTGPKVPDSGLLSNAEIVFLHPALEPGSESYYCLQYERSLNYLMRGLR